MASNENCGVLFGDVRNLLSRGQRAVRAARERTGCEWISTTVHPKFQTAVVLVVYRPAGSSIIVDLSGPSDWPLAETFLGLISARDVKAELIAAAARLENKQGRSNTLRATSRLLKDAEILRAAAAAIKDAQ